jgi:methyl-accepting chemotaxis protein
MKKWLRGFQNIRWKITWAMFVLVLSAQIASMFVFRSVVDDALWRGRFLVKHLKRFNDDWSRGSFALVSAALAYGSEADVRAALRAGGESGPAAADAKTLRDHYEGLEKRLKPDLFALLDAHGRLVFVNDPAVLTADDLRSMKFAVTALDTELVVPVVHHGRLFVMAGVPIKPREGDALGTVLAGRDIVAYMTEFTKDSDEDVDKRHILTFATGGRVIASSAPRDGWDKLAAALALDNWVKRHEGTKEVDAILLGETYFDVYAEDLNGYSGGVEGTIGKLYITRNRSAQDSKQTDVISRTLFLLGASMLFALIIGYGVSTLLSRRVYRLIQKTGELARGGGDLTTQLDEAGHDELAQLAGNMNKMFANLRELALKVQGTSLQVGASSAEISAASKQMLAGAQDQASKIEDSSVAVTELSKSIQSVAENAGAGIRVAREGGDSVNKAIEGMNRIRVTVDDASLKIRELGESGKKIGNIVSVIQQISEQTSLLALNAAIEAARAGEQGRGFAVVADEVGQLAKRVGKSAKDIEALIASIKEQTETSVTTMQAGNREVESGASLVNDTLRHLTAIIGTVQDTARSVKEQAIVSDEIARNMEEVRRIANDMLNASKEAVVQGENLHSLAVGLEESVKGFKLARGGVDGAGGGGLSVGTALTAPPRAQLPVGGRAS